MTPGWIQREGGRNGELLVKNRMLENSGGPDLLFGPGRTFQVRGGGGGKSWLWGPGRTRVYQSGVKLTAVQTWVKEIREGVGTI